MKIDNKSFWEKDYVIATQERIKHASDFEYFMFENALKRNPTIKNIKIFGCGTGREIKSIAEFFKPTAILASDIAENMIAKCKQNLKEWGIETITSTFVGDAKNFTTHKNEFELVTILNSMLTYVPERKDRLTIFHNSLEALTPQGVIIGTVHNQVGTPLKTLYFKMRSLFSFVLGDKVGNRNTGFKGFSVPGYYYAKKGLIRDLKEVGFTTIEVYSLQEFYAMGGKFYNAKKGYNNLIFVASKP